MATNVLPLFWHLASSSKDTRLTASAELVGAAQEFQASYAQLRASLPADEEEDEDDQDEDDDDDVDDDDESGIEVDADDDGDADTAAEDAKLDRQLARDNAEDVVYCVKRLVRGLGSSRESSRLGFAVALTETLSLLVRESRWSAGMKGSDERDAMFARLFGLTALVNSGALFRPTTSAADFARVLDLLAEVGEAKPWLRESVGWAAVCAVRGLLRSDVDWKDEGVRAVVERRIAGQPWTQEKVALVIVLQEARPWKALIAPTFKYAGILASGNLVTLGRILKESGSDDDDGVDASTGSWKPQLHFVWNVILDAYFEPAAGSTLERAPFQDLFRVVVDESFFANSSSAERKYHGFQIFSRALALVAPRSLPQIFTPNLMRSWMNALTAADRHLHKVALATARGVHEAAAANPAVGFTLLSQLVGKHGRPDFDRVTRTKTVEAIMGSLSVDGVADYVAYLQAIVVGKDEAAADAAALEDRRVWALDQLLALCRNGSVPKNDAWVGPLLDFLLVHGFFIIRKADKKSPIAALHAVPKPPLAETTAAVARARFVSALVEVSQAQPRKTDARPDAAAAPPAQAPGCDAAGAPWVRRALDAVAALEADGGRHVEPAADADAEIRAVRARAAAVLARVRAAPAPAADAADKDVRRGVEVLLGFLILQTYDEVEDALDMLEEAVGAVSQLFDGKKGKKGKQAEPEGEAAAIDTLVDTLVQLLDKGSADLRALANLVFGLVSPALTESSLKHLVAATAADAAEQDADEDEDEDDVSEMADDDDAEDDDEQDEADEEDDDDSEEGDDVDPEFRRRVAAALQVSGLGVDEDAAADGDESEDEETWDDEQMMKVDEQLAAVFRERTGTTKRADLKHLQIENMHFKLRVLDLVDTYLRRQPNSPLAVLLVMPLLHLVRRAGPSEAELSTKATSIIRTRLGKASHYPAASPLALPVLDEVHALARHAATAELSALASAASLFVARAVPAPADADADAQDAVAAVYAQTLADFVGRKASSVHAPFLLEFARRHPLRAWRIRADLVAAVAPGAGANAYRQQAVYGLLGALAQHLGAISRARPAAEVAEFARAAAAQVHATLEAAAEGGAFKADRLKEVVKFALGLARAAKAAGVAWDVERLRAVERAVVDGHTKSAGGVVGLVRQLVAVVAGKDAKSAKQDKTDKTKAQAGVDADGDVGMDAGADGDEAKPKKRKAAADKPKADGSAKPKKVKKAKKAATAA